MTRSIPSDPRAASRRGPAQVQVQSRSDFAQMRAPRVPSGTYRHQEARTSPLASQSPHPGPSFPLGHGWEGHGPGPAPDRDPPVPPPNLGETGVGGVKGHQGGPGPGSGSAAHFRRSAGGHVGAAEAAQRCVLGPRGGAGRLGPWAGPRRGGSAREMPGGRLCRPGRAPRPARRPPAAARPVGLPRAARCLGDPAPRAPGTRLPSLTSRRVPRLGLSLRRRPSAPRRPRAEGKGSGRAARAHPTWAKRRLPRRPCLVSERLPVLCFRPGLLPGREPQPRARAAPGEASGRGAPTPAGPRWSRRGRGSGRRAGPFRLPLRLLPGAGAALPALQPRVGAAHLLATRLRGPRAAPAPAVKPWAPGLAA